MSDLLGMSIDNVVEHHSVINAKVGVQEYLSQLNNKIADGESVIGEQTEMHGINMSKITDIIEGLEVKELEKKRNQDTYGNTLGIYL